MSNDHHWICSKSIHYLPFLWLLSVVGPVSWLSSILLQHLVTPQRRVPFILTNFQKIDFFSMLYTYMLFAGWEVRIVKNCDRGLENAVRGRRPSAGFSRPRSQFVTIRTDPKPVKNLFIFLLRTKNCFNFCKHKDKISRKRYRSPWADIGESCPR